MNADLEKIAAQFTFSKGTAGGKVVGGKLPTPTKVSGGSGSGGTTPPAKTTTPPANSGSGTGAPAATPAGGTGGGATPPQQQTPPSQQQQKQEKQPNPTVEAAKKDAKQVAGKATDWANKNLGGAGEAVANSNLGQQFLNSKTGQNFQKTKVGKWAMNNKGAAIGLAGAGLAAGGLAIGAAIKRHKEKKKMKEQAQMNAQVMGKTSMSLDEAVGYLMEKTASRAEDRFYQRKMKEQGYADAGDYGKVLKARREVEGELATRKSRAAAEAAADKVHALRREIDEKRNQSSHWNPSEHSLTARIQHQQRKMYEGKNQELEREKQGWKDAYSAQRERARSLGKKLNITSLENSSLRKDMAAQQKKHDSELRTRDEEYTKKMNDFVEDAKKQSQTISDLHSTIDKRNKAIAGGLIGLGAAGAGLAIGHAIKKRKEKKKMKEPNTETMKDASEEFAMYENIGAQLEKIAGVKDWTGFSPEDRRTLKNLKAIKKEERTPGVSKRIREIQGKRAGTVGAGAAAAGAAVGGAIALKKYLKKKKSEQKKEALDAAVAHLMEKEAGDGCKCKGKKGKLGNLMTDSTKSDQSADVTGRGGESMLRQKKALDEAVARLFEKA